MSNDMKTIFQETITRIKPKLLLNNVCEVKSNDDFKTMTFNLEAPEEDVVEISRLIHFNKIEEDFITYILTQI